MSYTAFLSLFMLAALFRVCLCFSASACAFPRLPVLSASAYLISKHYANFYNRIEIHAKKGLDSLLNQILLRCI